MSDKIMLENTEENKMHGRILLAEDDDSMRRFIEVILKRENYRVFSARDGIEALEIALANDIDIAITDAVMPNMTGFDLCRMLRRNPEKKHISLIILSGFDKVKDDDFEECLADFYLSKGNNLKNELIETLSKIVTRKSDSKSVV